MNQVRLLCLFFLITFMQLPAQGQSQTLLGEWKLQQILVDSVLYFDVNNPNLTIQEELKKLHPTLPQPGQHPDSLELVQWGKRRHRELSGAKLVLNDDSTCTFSRINMSNTREPNEDVSARYLLREHTSQIEFRIDGASPDNHNLFSVYFNQEVLRMEIPSGPWFYVFVYEKP